MKTLNTQYQIHPEAFATEVDNQVVILQYETGTYFTLNAIGTRIWQLLEEEKTVQEILSQLLQEYKVDEKQLHQDISNLMERLKEKGLIL